MNNAEKLEQILSADDYVVECEADMKMARERYQETKKVYEQAVLTLREVIRKDPDQMQLTLLEGGENGDPPAVESGEPVRGDESTAEGDAGDGV